MKLSYIHFTIFIFLGLTSVAQATVVGAPTCSVKAEILQVNRGKENPLDFKGAKTIDEPKHARFRIISIEKIGPEGNCDFLKVEEVIQTDGGSSPEILKEGTILEAGASYNVGLGPQGTVPFIQWQPITLFNEKNEKVQLPEDFHLQSSAEENFKPIPEGPVPDTH